MDADNIASCINFRTITSIETYTKAVYEVKRIAVEHVMNLIAAACAVSTKHRRQGLAR